VIVAKAVILRSIGGSEASAQALLESVVKAAGVAIPDRLILHPSEDTPAAVRAFAEGFSWKLAAIEAICSLVGSGVLIAGQSHWWFEPSVPWTTVPRGGGSGTSGGFNLPELAFAVPTGLRRAPSLGQNADRAYLSDPDLYLGLLAIANMHVDVQAALREAIKCFRSELWLAAVAMLGKASEGAWIELGGALLDAAGSTHIAKFQKQRDVLEDTMAGPAKKIDA
jgi:hypothetical protein